MDFDVDKTISYWIESAEYDRGVADALFRVEKYPYALFMVHLALEKLLKALVVKNTKSHAPYTHSLPLLASKLSIELPQEIKKKLARFMEFYFEARYPVNKRIFTQNAQKSLPNET
jgi:HEPN domain-containing protein